MGCDPGELVRYVHNGPFVAADLVELFERVGFNRLQEWKVQTVAKAFGNTDHSVLAQAGAHPIGFVRLMTDWYTRGSIGDLCVAPDYRRHGIGRTLMREIVRICDDNGIPVLNLYDTSRIPGFYKSLGFASEATATGMYRLHPARRLTPR